MNDKLIEKPNTKEVWMRALFMLLFVIIYSIAEIVLTAVVVFQFIHILITRDKNQRLLDLGNNISKLIFQILQFLTFNSENHPYPLGDWPTATEHSVSNKPDDYT